MRKKIINKDLKAVDLRGFKKKLNEGLYDSFPKKVIDTIKNLPDEMIFCSKLEGAIDMEITDVVEPTNFKSKLEEKIYRILQDVEKQLGTEFVRGREFQVDWQCPAYDYDYKIKKIIYDKLSDDEQNIKYGEIVSIIMGFIMKYQLRLPVGIFCSETYLLLPYLYEFNIRGFITDESSPVNAFVNGRYDRFEVHPTYVRGHLKKGLLDLTKLPDYIYTEPGNVGRCCGKDSPYVKIDGYDYITIVCTDNNRMIEFWDYLLKEIKK